MDMNNLFDSAAADLEKSIKEGETKKPTQDEISKAVAQKVQEAVDIMKGGTTSDLSADKDKRGTLLETSEDPAKTPKKSGGGYPDSKPYVSKKGDDMEEEEGEDDEMPAFFKKKSKMKKKMAKKSDEEASDEPIDATEFMEDMQEGLELLGKSVFEMKKDLRKSVSELTDGVAVFGELLTEMADPRRVKMEVAMAKAMSHLVDRVNTIEKSMNENMDLIKSITTKPGAPRVAGTVLAKSEVEEIEASTIAVTPGDRSRLFKAAQEKTITMDEYKTALRTGDSTILAKAQK